jgi:hypothetical protein
MPFSFDIVGGSFAPTFNAAFVLNGVMVPGAIAGAALMNWHAGFGPISTAGHAPLAGIELPFGSSASWPFFRVAARFDPARIIAAAGICRRGYLRPAALVRSSWYYEIAKKFGQSR